ncbi:FAD binding domain-containing protein [Rubrobacter indicoceani]|uniref:FAD binding domain-containing protein n=1 Tax=Rubrobacter indicoceani TaxID=2051957 RepID=UPI000E5C1717|nr:xanthine dehydrogenase family protein subunit M [Rubrobacter indicoceani]
MIPKEFEYLAPTSIEEAVGLLQEHGGRAKVLAGGHGLIPRMKRRLEEPRVLMDVGRIPELRGIRRENGCVVIGATTTHAELEAATDLLGAVHILPQTAGVVADPLVRNRGTFGGSLADAESAADWPAVVLALDATLHAVGPNGARSIPARGFFLGLMETALKPEEILTSIEVAVPEAPPGGWVGMRYEKLTHPASGYAVVGVAAVVTADERGICRSCRVAVTGACSRATRATATEDLLVGGLLVSEAISRAAGQAAEGLDLVGDHHASASYRKHLVTVYAERALLASAPSS